LVLWKKEGTDERIPVLPRLLSRYLGHLCDAQHKAGAEAQGCWQQRTPLCVLMAASSPIAASIF